MFIYSLFENLGDVCCLVSLVFVCFHIDFNLEEHVNVLFINTI